MAGRIILSLCCFLCAGGFFLNTYLCGIKNTPVTFWNGSDNTVKNLVRDVPNYNREMKKAFLLHAAIWLLCGIASAFSPMAGLLLLPLQCTLGLFLLWKRYKQLLTKYS